MIIKVTSGAIDRYALCYKFSIVATDPYYYGHVYVDAASGKVVKNVNKICTANVPCTGQSLYNGTVSFTGDGVGAGSRLRAVNAGGVQINTYNLNHGSAPSTPVDFTDVNTSWTSAEHGNNIGAVDIHSNTQLILNYWRTTHGRNGLNGSGGAINSWFHWGTGINNAGWADIYNGVLYGDGGAFGLGPFVAVDICAHEIGHGVDYYVKNLDNTGLTGALKESFGDMCAAAQTAAIYPLKNAWWIGEELGFASRYLNNPSILGHPDTYLGTGWFNVATCSNPDPQTNDMCGVHNNSTVPSFAFFLMSQGGVGTNDVGGTYSVSGIGIAPAFRIAYEALLDYLPQDADFFDARTAFISAARELYGYNSCQEIAVTNAWAAVNVGAAFNTAAINIAGSINICSGTTLTLQGPTASSWSVSPAGVVNLTPGANNTASVTRVTDGTATVSAVINTCGVSMTVNKFIRSGITSGVATMAAPNPIQAGAMYNQFRVTTTVPISNYTWTLPSGWSLVLNPNSFSPVIQTGSGSTGQTRTVKCTITGCGSAGMLQQTVTFGPGGPDPIRMRRDTLFTDSITNVRLDTVLLPDAQRDDISVSLKAYPIPSSTSLVVEAVKDLKGFSSVALVNTLGAVVKYQKCNGVAKVTLDVSDLPAGMYLLKVNDQQQIIRKIIIQH